MLFGGLILIWLLMVLIGIGSLVVYIFYLITLSRTLELCHPQTRKMNPGEVWLVFIPLFGLVWHFIVIGRVADSLSAEFRNRNLPVEEERPGYQTGLWALILMLCGIIPFVGVLAVLTGFVMLIMYWNRIRDYKNRLEQHNAHFMGGAPNVFQQAPVQYQNPLPPQYPPHNP